MPRRQKQAGKDAGRHLRRLLPLKGHAEYEPDPVTPGEAATAVQSAERIFAIADRIITAPAPDPD